MRRLPFKRGFNNIFRINYQEVNVGYLEEIFDAGTVVTPELLAERGLIRNADKPIAILGDGDLTKKLTVSGHRFTKSAAEKITKAGGSIDKRELLVKGAHATVKLLPKARLEQLKNAE